jgi:hypothetical protein
MTREAALAGLRAIETSARGCYLESSSVDPVKPVSARYRLSVRRDGSVESVGVVEDLIDDAVVSPCLSRTLAGVRFERLAGAQRATVTVRVAFP